MGWLYNKKPKNHKKKQVVTVNIGHDRSCMKISVKELAAALGKVTKSLKFLVQSALETFYN